MKEFIEKLIGRLEGESYLTTNDDGETNKFSVQVVEWKDIKKIVNQLAEEYNNGWIPVSSGNPKETGLYQVTVDDNDEPVITAMYLAEVDIWSYHAGYGNYMKVLAWRSLPQPYQPKGE